MKRYCVKFERQALYTEKGYLYVEAESEDEAIELATQKAANGEEDEIESFETCTQKYSPDEIEITDVEEDS